MKLDDHLTHDPASGVRAAGYNNHLWDESAKPVYYTLGYVSVMKASDRKARAEAAKIAQDGPSIADGMKTCASPNCERTFYPVGRQVTCGNPHCNTAYKKMRRKVAVPESRVCAGCGFEFSPRRTDHIYCGGGCANKVYRERRKEDVAATKQQYDEIGKAQIAEVKRAFRETGGIR